MINESVSGEAANCLVYLTSAKEGDETERIDFERSPRLHLLESDHCGADLQILSWDREIARVSSI